VVAIKLESSNIIPELDICSFLLSHPSCFSVRLYTCSAAFADEVGTFHEAMRAAKEEFR
jgi:hypothetical protein